ncbi:MAG: CapA family protein [Clostridiales bacterium]|nr:CapA family protein [Clostridiales bacterium]
MVSSTRNAKRKRRRATASAVAALIVSLILPVFLCAGSNADADSVKSMNPSGKLTITESRKFPFRSRYTAPESDASADLTIEGFVDHLYLVAMGRTSDPAGKEYWVRELSEGNLTGADIARAFLSSDEFSGKQLSHPAFLDALYLTFFGREPDESGKVYWLNELNAGRKSRDVIIDCFIDSTEWCNICASYGVKSGAPTAKATKASTYSKLFTTRLYTYCLNREPEDDGLKYWSMALTNQETSAMATARFFFESSEFIGIKTSNEDFLDRLYATYLGREPDSDGISYWLGQLDKSMDRKQVIEYFSKSPEFRDICKRYGFLEEEPPVDEPVFIELIAVGDNLYHDKIIQSGRQSDGSYNYDRIYENIKDEIKDAEIKVINQEVLLTGNSSMWSGYPQFASPLEAGTAVVKAGFNVITHATNHSWDKGRSVVLDDVSFWKSQEGVLLTGLYASQKDYDTIVVGEYSGIKVAFLNYTFDLNGFVLPSDSKYMVKLLDMDLVRSDIAKAREQADIVIVFPHWGEEYTHTPNSYQRNLAQQMADAGADLIIGCHPHVIQPLEIVVSNTGKKVPCYYSLGNFVSNMSQPERSVEAMARVSFKKDGDKVTIDYAEAVPLVNHVTDDGKYTVYPAGNYTTEIAHTHRNWNVTPSYVYSLWNRVFTQSRFTNISE